MPEYRLTYFDIEGLAEPIRLLFCVAGVPFEDVRMPYTPGQPGVIPPEIKQKLPYGQVPILEFDDTIISQSGAIGRYVAKKFDMYGANELEAAKIDEILDAFRDYMEGYKALRMAKDDDAKEVAKKNVIEVFTPRYAKKFNEILEQNGTGFYVGSSLTLADVVLAHFIAQFNILLPGLTKDYPGIEAHVKKIEAIPQIHEWIQKRSKTA